MTTVVPNPLKTMVLDETLPLTTTVCPAVAGMMSTVTLAEGAVQTPFTHVNSGPGWLPAAHPEIGGGETGMKIGYDGGHANEHSVYEEGHLQAAEVSSNTHVEEVSLREAFAVQGESQKSISV